MPASNHLPELQKSSRATPQSRIFTPRIQGAL
jgi:hypothetical protein